MRNPNHAMRFCCKQEKAVVYYVYKLMIKREYKAQKNSPVFCAFSILIPKGRVACRIS